jgi:hypothetical protein
MNLIEGDTFTDPGYTATDDVDGDITANVTVAGDILDTYTPGSYVLTYNVSDAADNAAAEVTRTVIVSENITASRATIEAAVMTAPFEWVNSVGNSATWNNNHNAYSVSGKLMYVDEDTSVGFEGDTFFLPFAIKAPADMDITDATVEITGLKDTAEVVNNYTGSQFEDYAGDKVLLVVWGVEENENITVKVDWDGEGTAYSESTYTIDLTNLELLMPIASAGDLYNVRNNLGGNYIQVADIDLSAYTNWEPIGGSWDRFSGSYYGNGYEISNLTVQVDTNYCYGGLFGEIWGRIEDVRLTEVSIASTAASPYAIGGLAGYLGETGTIYNCHVQGSISGNGAAYVGGLVGWQYGGTIEECSAVGSVSQSGTGYTGGLVGGTRNPHILRSFAAVNVTSNGPCTGGLVGSNGGVIEQSYAVGDVTSTSYWIGGLVGNNSPFDIECAIIECYATGKVSGNSSIGGLVGINSNATIESSYYDKDTAGCNVITGGTPKSTADMKNQETFIGWDFGNTWTIGEGTYPYLQWQGLFPTVPNQNQAAPTGLEAVAPTAAGSDGKITGTTAVMEYKLATDDESAYVPCSHTETTGLSAGDYVVRLAAKTGYNASLATTVTVPAYVAPAIISVAIEPATASVVQGGTQQLAATVVAVGGADQTVNWTSSDVTETVTVAATGLVTVAADAAAGEYTITATSTFDDTKSDTLTITVTATQKEITGFTALTPIGLDADEQIVDIAALKSSGKLPATVTVTDGTTPVDATITDWTGTFDGTATGAQTLTAVWMMPAGCADVTDTISVTITVNVNVVQTALSSDAILTSTIGTVDSTEGTIVNIPEETTLADFKAAIATAAGATFEVYQADGTTIATDLATGCKVIVTAEDSTTTKIYTLTVEAPDSLITAVTFTAAEGLQEGNTNAAAYAIVGALGTTGGDGTITYGLAVNAVIPENSADNDKFIISGTDVKIGTTALTAGTYKFNVEATDADGDKFQQACTIIVAAQG